MIISMGGTKISVFLKAGMVSCCCVVPVPAIGMCFSQKYKYFADTKCSLGIAVISRTIGT